MENRDWELFRNGESDNLPLSSSPQPDESKDVNLAETEPNEGGGGGEGEEESRELPDPDTDIYPSFYSESFLPENSNGTEPDQSDADREKSEPDGIDNNLETRNRVLFTPVYFANNNGHTEKGVKKKHTSLKVIGLMAAAVLIIAIIAACEILSGYDISVMSSNSGIEIVLKDRNTEESLWSGDGESSVLPSDVPGITSGADAASETEAEQVPIYQAGDGTTLEVSQIFGEKYTLQEIYDRCIVSIVLVNVGLDGGYATGTGIIMSQDGYIITNEHVIEGATSIDIELQDSTVYTAALVGKDSQTDLAVLKIDAENLMPASFGDSSTLRVGDEVAAIGNPLGLNFSLSNGIISALDRDVEVNGYYMTMIQTNVAINEGNSGGALINMYGQVIGITNMKLVSYSAYSSIEGMAFAIPTSVVKPVVDSIIAEGYVTGRPALGIMCATLNAQAAEREGLPEGVYVSSIYEGSGAFGKLETGDVITAANGTQVLTNEDLNNVKNGLVVGDTLTLTIFRNDETFDVDIILIDAALIEY